MTYNYGDFEADATDAYEEAAFWTSESQLAEEYRQMGHRLVTSTLGSQIYCGVCGHGGCEEDAEGSYNLSEDARREMATDVRGFLADIADLDLGTMSAAQVGHDFWLTRNGHGAGFWDRGLGALGDELTKRCKPYGEASLYVGDNGEVEYYS